MCELCFKHCTPTLIRVNNDSFRLGQKRVRSIRPGRRRFRAGVGALLHVPDDFLSTRRKRRAAAGATPDHSCQVIRIRPQVGGSRGRLRPCILWSRRRPALTARRWYRRSSSMSPEPQFECRPSCRSPAVGLKQGSEDTALQAAGITVAFSGMHCPSGASNIPMEPTGHIPSPCPVVLLQRSTIRCLPGLVLDGRITAAHGLVRRFGRLNPWVRFLHWVALRRP